MTLTRRIQMLFGWGPKFILAEQGTDPLNEPDLYKRRRKRGSPWPLIITGGLALIAIVGLLAWYIPAHYR